MKTCVFLVAAAGLAAAGALAQQPSRDGVARLKDVKGNVLLSREAGLAAGSEATRVIEHTRVITTARSEVTIVFDNGCEVHLEENQRFEVDSRRPCAALIAGVESILVQPAGVALAGAGAASGFWTVVPAIGGALIGAEILGGSTGPRQTPLSPS